MSGTNSFYPLLSALIFEQVSAEIQHRSIAVVGMPRRIQCPRHLHRQAKFDRNNSCPKLVRHPQIQSLSCHADSRRQRTLSRLFPWVSVWLVVVNVVVFVAQVSIGAPFTDGYSLVPEEITTFQDLIGTKVCKVWVYTRDQNSGRTGRYVEKNVLIQHYPGPVPICLTLLTSMFMHGSFFHLFFNMWSLLIFGRNVECAMGHWRFLAFYLACGLLAGLAHVASDMHSIIPYLGASGAIAGVMGAYVSIYPLNRIKILFILPWIIELPALVVIGGWVILQYFSAMIVNNQAGGIAYWAHLGGFFAGFIILRLLVFILQQQLADAAREKSHRPRGQSATANPVESTQTKPNTDPYGGFVTMQTVRRMQEKENREHRRGGRP